VFARARENARKSSCQSNLKQIALGVIQYTQDYDEVLMPGYVGGPRPRWVDNIQPYMKNSDCLTCPSFANQKWRGYGYNTCLSGYTPMALIQKPSETVLVADGARVTYPTPNDLDPSTWVANSNCDWQISWPQNGHWTPGSCCGGAGARRFHARHLDGGNVAWVDGHVKWTRGMDICANVPEGNPACLWDLQ